jgi:ABC-type lipoprotein export system ATPase subunit
MLEVRNISRIYKPKKGVPVRALDNVSLKFPEKGMVFILGKSGSGKSTLLNVMGGLDRCDAGEIIIKGKSSKDFSQNDFDSYRNTYLGFIFQEFNILNDFTVGANIGLALELQGKKATNEEINRILEEVDLVGYGDRKPTELSGGQKQRVAIARALVKNPEIILADEPTGSLDSKTGMQVFETLKKLSQDKLVIIVTHDREYAEYFGDRVIEFKDGKVISDIEKYLAPSFRKNPFISIVDDKIISVKKGYQLTDEDVALINNYIRNHNAIISIDDRANEDLKKFARIDSEGNKEAFKDTDESKIHISKDKSFKLIKSRLPWKNSFKIGASGLKSKPFRLVLTILLSVVAFTMAGLTDTMGSYDKYAATTRSFIDSKIDTYVLQKQQIIYEEEYDYQYTRDLLAADDDIQRLKEETGLNFRGLYKPQNTSFSLRHYANDETKTTLLYERLELSGFYGINQDDIDDLGFSYSGKLPNDYNEIAISQYVFSFFDKCGFNNRNGLVIEADDINSVEDFLNEEPFLPFGNTIFTITAVIDTQFDYDQFKLLDDIEMSNNISYYFKLEELWQTVMYGYHGMIFTCEDFAEHIMRTKNIGIELYNANISFELEIEDISHYPRSALKYEDLTEDNIVFFDKTKNKLQSNEVIFPASIYSYWLSNEMNRKYQTDDAPQWYKDYEEELENNWERLDDYLLDEFIPNNYPEGFYVKETFEVCDYETGEYVEYHKDNYTLEDMKQLDEAEKHLVYLMYLKADGYRNEWANYTYYSLEEGQKSLILFDIITNNNNVLSDLNNLGINTPNMRYNNYFKNIYDNVRNCEIVGIYYLDSIFENYDAPVVFDDQFYAELAEYNSGHYSFLIAPMPSSESEVAELVKFGYDNIFDNDISYEMKNGVMATLTQVNSLIESMATIFLYLGIGFAVFASLMLMNFIATSINYKSKEIGILRAIGARSSDVFGIFFNESMIIAAINYIISIAATFGVVLWINHILRTDYQLLITVLIFGFRQLLLMLVISVGVAFISSFLPVMRIARKKPVDAMKK